MAAVCYNENIAREGRFTVRKNFFGREDMALKDYIDMKPTIGTERLTIRPLCADDVPALREWMSEPSIYTYWGKGPGRTDKDPALLFEKKGRPTKSFHLGIEEKASGKVIGELYIYRIINDRTATAAIRLAPGVQGRGYGTEALCAMTRFCFERTELKRLYAEVDLRNIPSQRMLEKCGFQREKLVRQGKMVSTLCDYYLYALSSAAERE